MGRREEGRKEGREGGSEREEGREEGRGREGGRKGGTVDRFLLCKVMKNGLINSHLNPLQRKI